MKILMKIIVSLYLLSFAACDGMSSIHEEYLKWGEAIYTGAIDSLEADPGYNRVHFKWNLSTDPRITKVVIYWNNRADSTVENVSRKRPVKTKMECTLDLKEGGYVFEFVTKDDENHQSRYVESSVTIYGSVYESSIAMRKSRKVKFIEAVDSERVNVYFDVVDANTFRNTQLSYISYAEEQGGKEKKIIVDNQVNMITLDKVKLGEYISAQSIYYPAENSLDGMLSLKNEYQIPSMLLPAPDSYSIVKLACFYGTTDRSKDSGTVQLDVATGEFAQGESCYTIPLGIENYNNWKLGIKINDDYSVRPYIAKVNGSWVVEYIRYDEQKNYYDPPTKTLYVQYEVNVPGAWTISSEICIKRVTK